MEEKESLVLKIRICMRITMIFGMVLVVAVMAELLLIRFAPEADWAKKLVQLLGFLAMASPLGILIPLFFRVNYQSRLIRLNSMKKEEKDQKGSGE